MPACTLLHMHMDGGTCHRDAERQRKENRDRPKIRGKGEEGREEGEEEEKKEEEKFYFLSRWKLRVTMPGECSTWHRPGIPWDFPSLPPSLPPSFSLLSPSTYPRRALVDVLRMKVEIAIYFARWYGAWEGSSPPPSAALSPSSSPHGGTWLRQLPRARVNIRCRLAAESITGKNVPETLSPLLCSRRSLSSFPFPASLAR